MPHARSEDGVFKTGFAVTTFADPITIADRQFHFVIALCSINSDDHLVFMKKIPALLSKIDLPTINQYQLADELYDVLTDALKEK